MLRCADFVAAAKALADNGVNIVVWDKNKEAMEQTQKEVSAHIRNGNFFIQQVVDVTDSSNVHLSRSSLWPRSKRRISSWRPNSRSAG